MAKQKAKPKVKAKARPGAKAKKAGSGRSAARATKAAAPKRPAPTASRPKGARPSSGPGVRPLRDHVILKRIEAAEGKVGSLYVPDSAREKPLEAEVVAVGSGRTLKNGKKVPLQLAPGNRVLVGKWSGSEVKLGDEEFLILREDEVLVILG